MKFNNPYWSNRTKINLLQRWLIVHSILYYELGESVVDDNTFNENAKQLVKMQEEFPEDAVRSLYYYAFNDFDGSTGFDLFYRLTNEDSKYLMHIAKWVLKQQKSGGTKKK